MTETVLITGCSSGIGRATARRFLDAGWTVYATARTLADVQDLSERGCRTAELDVTNDRQAAAVVDTIFEEAGHLDCLVNNAGYGQFGAVADVPIDAVVRQFDVNTFGPLRLIQAVLPRMCERGRGTILNVTAGVGGFSLPGMGIYTASKYALESATVSLRQEVSGSGVGVTYVEPGVVATDFYDRVLDELDGVERSAAYDDLYRVLDSLGAVEGGGTGIHSPERVAETILHAATTEYVNPVYRVGLTTTLATYAGRLLRGRLRDGATRSGIRALASGPAQRLLERRERRVKVAEPPTRNR